MLTKLLLQQKDEKRRKKDQREKLKNRKAETDLEVTLYSKVLSFVYVGASVSCCKCLFDTLELIWFVSRLKTPKKSAFAKKLRVSIG